MGIERFTGKAGPLWAVLVILLSFAALSCGPATSGADNPDPGAASAAPASPGVGSPASGYKGTRLAEPLPKPEFILADTAGAPFDFRAETEGYVTLLYFGYTNCPDVCPSHFANISTVLDRLGTNVAEKVKVVFVSVDPERDTPARLRDWLDNFDASFVGLTGEFEAIDAVMRETLGTYYFALTKEQLASGAYATSHTSFVLAYTEDNFAHFVYPFRTLLSTWQNDLAVLVRDGWTGPAATVEPTPAHTVSDSGTDRERLDSPRRLQPNEARKLLGGAFFDTTIEEARRSIELAFEKYPESSRFMSQGLMIPIENLDLDIRICGSKPDLDPDASLLACSTLQGCARLARVLYDYYVQSGYEEFYTAALNVYNFVATSLPDEAEAFYFLLRSELRVSGLPD